jgi:hypothetical protein
MLGMTFDPERRPLEIIVREERIEKSNEQRKLFHAVCADLAPHLGLTPRACKLRMKADFYGVEVVNEDGVIVAVVPSSEDSDREEYSRLIDHTYQFAAEQSIALADRRTK